MLIRRPGQTMLEMIIAIAVITISTLASTTLIVSTIRTGRVSQARVVAANLGREGIEVARGIRDSNWLKADQNVIDYHTPAQPTDTTVAWNDTGLTTDGQVPLSGTYVTVFDPATSTWKLVAAILIGANANTTIFCVTPTGTTCATATSANLYETQLATGASACPAGYVCTSTGYARTVTITAATESVLGNSVGYVSVVSTVTGGGLTSSIIASERLYNWK